MADFLSLESRVYPPYLPEDRRALEQFLGERGLQWESDIECSVACLAEGRVVGTGSLAGRVIKCLAVDDAVQGEGLAARMFSLLEGEAVARGFANPFVYTVPRNLELFRSMGYRFVGEVPETMVLLEKGDGIEGWKHALQAIAGSSHRTPGDVSALVMNCNPITWGHLHLIRTAAERTAHVFVFVVAEDASAFPAEVRLRLVQEEAAVFPNVTVVGGTDYFVSRATFPSYFLKDCLSPLAEVHARLDVDIFARHIAPAVGATRRFIGEEPHCPVTALYNRVMKDLLPARGIEVVEIPRLELGGAAVSASMVRRLIREGNTEGVRDLVPGATARFLASDEGQGVIQRIRASQERH